MYGIETVYMPPDKYLHLQQVPHSTRIKPLAPANPAQEVPTPPPSSEQSHKEGGEPQKPLSTAEAYGRLVSGIEENETRRSSSPSNRRLRNTTTQAKGSPEQPRLGPRVEKDPELLAHKSVENTPLNIPVEDPLGGLGPQRITVAIQAEFNSSLKPYGAGPIMRDLNFERIVNNRKMNGSYKEPQQEESKWDNIPLALGLTVGNVKSGLRKISNAADDTWEALTHNKSTLNTIISTGDGFKNLCVQFTKIKQFNDDCMREMKNQGRQDYTLDQKEQLAELIENYKKAKDEHFQDRHETIETFNNVAIGSIMAASGGLFAGSALVTASMQFASGTVSTLIIRSAEQGVGLAQLREGIANGAGGIAGTYAAGLVKLPVQAAAQLFGQEIIETATKGLAQDFVLVSKELIGQSLTKLSELAARTGIQNTVNAAVANGTATYVNGGDLEATLKGTLIGAGAGLLGDRTGKVLGNVVAKESAVIARGLAEVESKVISGEIRSLVGSQGEAIARNVTLNNLAGMYGSGKQENPFDSVVASYHSYKEQQSTYLAERNTHRNIRPPSPDDSPKKTS